MIYDFDVELPEGYKDAVYVDCDIHFDWRDRIKVLLGYKVTVKTQVLCVYSPGITEAKSVISVWKPRRHGITYVYSPEDDK